MKTFSTYIKKNSTRLFGAMALVLFLAATLVPANLYAQQGKGKMAMADSAHHEPYNVNTIETVVGKVARINYLPGRMEGMVGMHVMLETERETIEVHFGPYNYISSQSLQVEQGDIIEVTGSRITHEEKPAILAARIKRGEEMLELRDEQGKPKWRGHGKQHNQH